MKQSSYYMMLLFCTEKNVSPRLSTLLENWAPATYYAMDSWFVKMTAVKEMFEFNSQVEWAPDCGRRKVWRMVTQCQRLGNQQRETLEPATCLDLWRMELNTALALPKKWQRWPKMEVLVAQDSTSALYVDDTILICPECNGDMKREPFRRLLMDQAHHLRNGTTHSARRVSSKTTSQLTTYVRE